MAQMKNILRLSFNPRESNIDFKRLLFLLLGVVLFFSMYCVTGLPDAMDPAGKVIPLSPEGKSAIALFLLAATWWVFEVIPIGVTGIMIGVIQCLFHIRDERIAFTDFMDPSVWFIFGSIVFGLVFTKTGLAKRMAYKMLILVGERTSLIYLGCFLMTAFLTLIMAHTAVAATLYPLFMAIYTLYGEGEKPTRFGKGLFIGMAFTAGAGSVITLLGSARAAVAIGFFKDMAGREVTFFEMSYFMAPLGFTMVLLLWGCIMILFKPERPSIPGLKDRARDLEARLGPVSVQEKLALTIIFITIAVLGLRSFVPFFNELDKSAIILLSTVTFFLFNVLSIKDLENIPWNIILLFGGAMSIGFCLWQTGAAEWLAIHWLTLFRDAHWFVFVIGISCFVMLTTNLIMNVAAIAISLPVALIIAPYLNIAPEVIFYASLAAAGMPFLLIVGAAPNAIAYNSRQFTSGEFFKAGIPASILLLIVLGAFVLFIWPMLGMPVHLTP